MVSSGIFMKRKLNKAPDYLTPLLEQSPAAWALIRANEIRHLHDIKFNPPVLDVGCGDGFVAKIILQNRNQQFDWGIDLSPNEISIAKKSGIYKNCKVANVYNLPFKNNFFQTVFSNSVIEHIPDLHQSISEMSRVLKTNGELIITVPTPYLTSYLAGVNLFKKLKLKFLANLYGKFFNKMFAHYNLHDHKSWEKILLNHKLKLKSHTYYHNKKMIQTHELLSYLSLPYIISKFFLGYWLTFPRLRKILIVPWLKKILYPLYLEDSKAQGGSVLIIAKKIK